MEREVRLRAGAVELDATLGVPPDASGVVVFAHGSGSSRRSPRNRYVAGRLQQGGFATLLLDLLTPEEAREDLISGALRFDVPRLAGRLVGAIDGCGGLGPWPIGLFGASTGAAAALVAAAVRPDRVRAVVSRGGRPDLAGEHLAQVRAPTLLIVGGADPDVLRLNEHARAHMQAEVRLEIVPGAGHLFEEPGALEVVVELARGWFARTLAPAPV